MKHRNNRLKDAIQSSHYNVTSLALEIGVSRQSVSDWQNGWTMPTPANLERINSVLGTNLKIVKGIG
jgi:predicted transcriptional regulator